MWGCVGEILIHIFAFTFTFSRLVDDWMGVLERVGRDDMREMYAYFFIFPWGFFCVSLCVCGRRYNMTRRSSRLLSRIG